MLVEPVFLLCMEAICSLGCGCPFMAPSYWVLKEPEGEAALSMLRPGSDTELCGMEEAQGRAGLSGRVKLAGCPGLQGVEKLGAPGRWEMWGGQERSPQTQILNQPDRSGDLYPKSRDTLHQVLGLGGLGK